MIRKNLNKIIVAVCACFVIISFAGCGASGLGANVKDIKDAAKTTYFAQVNETSKNIKIALSDFKSNVEKKDVAGMQEKYNAAQNVIDEFNKIQVPANCQDVQKAYSDGYLQLQKSLSDYIQIYSDFTSGQINNDVLNERVAGVQNDYNMGLDLIKQADKLASEK